MTSINPLLRAISRRANCVVSVTMIEAKDVSVLVFGHEHVDGGMQLLPDREFNSDYDCQRILARRPTLFLMGNELNVYNLRRDT